MEDKKALIKEAIRKLHAGVPPEKVKEEFRNVLEKTDSLEIAKIEEELAKEGMKREEMRKLCDVHMSIFKEQLEKQQVKMQPNQPISILLEEHKLMLQIAEQLLFQANKVSSVTDIDYVKAEIHEIEHLTEDLADSDKHYSREENVLFPYLEKHGITEPPAVMWIEHNEIKEVKKNLRSLIGGLTEKSFPKFKNQLKETAKGLGNLLQNHFYKENNVLFPAAMSVITEQEWIDIRKEFDEIGYCCFTPSELVTFIPGKELPQEQLPTKQNTLEFETGSLSKEQLDGLLNTLPVDITFVDLDDTVQYFNKPEERLFVRTKAVLGRKVHMCHPQKSLHIVNEIVESFKKGRKNVAEFWITLNGRFVHIRFFAVRDINGKYVGTMEVVQDLTEIRKLEGERRLLDWKD